MKTNFIEKYRCNQCHTEIICSVPWFLQNKTPSKFCRKCGSPLEKITTEEKTSSIDDSQGENK